MPILIFLISFLLSAHDGSNAYFIEEFEDIHHKKCLEVLTNEQKKLSAVVQSFTQKKVKLVHHQVDSQFKRSVSLIKIPGLLRTHYVFYVFDHTGEEIFHKKFALTTSVSRVIMNDKYCVLSINPSTMYPQWYCGDRNSEYQTAYICKAICDQKLLIFSLERFSWHSIELNNKEPFYQAMLNDRNELFLRTPKMLKKFNIHMDTNIKLDKQPSMYPNEQILSEKVDIADDRMKEFLGYYNCNKRKISTDSLMKVEKIVAMNTQGDSPYIRKNYCVIDLFNNKANSSFDYIEDFRDAKLEDFIVFPKAFGFLHKKQGQWNLYRIQDEKWLPVEDENKNLNSSVNIYPYLDSTDTFWFKSGYSNDESKMLVIMPKKSLPSLSDIYRHGQQIAITMRSAIPKR